MENDFGRNKLIKIGVTLQTFYKFRKIVQIHSENSKENYFWYVCDMSLKNTVKTEPCQIIS